MFPEKKNTFVAFTNTELSPIQITAQLMIQISRHIKKRIFPVFLAWAGRYF